MRGLICDDHPLVREALAAAVRERWPGVVLTEAGDFPAAWALASDAPDFALVDLAMPGADPVTGIAGLRERAPEMALVAITGLTDERLLAAVRACGVTGLYSKNARTELLLEAIQAVVPGLQAVEAASLPDRQRAVLVLLGEGLTNKEIALRLGISPATVKIHVARLMTWLGAANRTDAVARAQRSGII